MTSISRSSRHFFFKNLLATAPNRWRSTNSTTNFSARRFFASSVETPSSSSSTTKKSIDSSSPPLKFSESAGFQYRRDRPQPSAKLLTFWEDVEVGGSQYKMINNASFMIATVVFMIYFLILREENDLDAELTKPLWQRLPSLEEQVVHERMILGKAKGEDVAKYEQRYQELQDERQGEQDRILKQRKK